MNIIKTTTKTNCSKSGPGLVLGRFGLQIRILREKLCRMMGSDMFFYQFLKIWLSGNLVIRHFIKQFP